MIVDPIKHLMRLASNFPDSKRVKKEIDMGLFSPILIELESVTDSNPASLTEIAKLPLSDGAKVLVNGLIKNEGGSHSYGIFNSLVYNKSGKVRNAKGELVAEKMHQGDFATRFFIVKRGVKLSYKDGTPFTAVPVQKSFLGQEWDIYCYATEVLGITYHANKFLCNNLLVNGELVGYNGLHDRGSKSQLVELCMHGRVKTAKRSQEYCVIPLIYQTEYNPPRVHEVVMNYFPDLVEFTPSKHNRRLGFSNDRSYDVCKIKGEVFESSRLGKLRNKDVCDIIATQVRGALTELYNAYLDQVLDNQFPMELAIPTYQKSGKVNVIKKVDELVYTYLFIDAYYNNPKYTRQNLLPSGLSPKFIATEIWYKHERWRSYVK